MTPYHLRPRLAKRKIHYDFRPRQPNRLQGNRRTFDDAEGETLVPITEIPQVSASTPEQAQTQTQTQTSTPTPAAVPEEQHAPQGSPGSYNPVEGISSPIGHPKKGRTQRIFVCIRDAPPLTQRSATSTLPLNNNRIELENQNPSSSEAGVHEHAILSKLKPPSRSEGFNNEEDYVQLLNKASLVLINEINKVKEANQMIDVCCKTFTLLDSFNINYMQLYRAVYSVVHKQCDIESLNEQRPHQAFVTKDVHEVTRADFLKVKRRKSEADIKFKDTEDKFDKIAAHVRDLEEEIKKAKEEKAKRREKLDAALAEKVSCDEVYYTKKSELKSTAAEMAKAQPVLDDFRRRYDETFNRLVRAKDELSRLKL